MHRQSLNRRDDLLVTAQRVEHLRIEILVVICRHCRKCSTPTAIDFMVLVGGRAFLSQSINSAIASNRECPALPLTAIIDSPNVTSAIICGD